MKKKPIILHLVNQLRVTASAIDQLWAHNRDKYDFIVLAYFDKHIDQNIKLPRGIRAYALGGSYGINDMTRLYKFIKDNSIDVIHTHHTFSSAVARIVGRYSNVKTLHEDGGGHPSYSLQSQILNTLSFWMSDIIVCVSNFVYDSFNIIEKMTVNKNKIRTVPYGVKLDYIRSLNFNRNDFFKQYGIKNDDFVISHTARLTPVKDEPYLIRLVAEMIKTMNNIKLIIAGDGEMKQVLEDLAQELGIKNNVIFTGMVSREEVYKILGFSDLFAMTSDSEGMSVSLIEALVMGVPVLLSDIPSFRETLAGENAGFLIDKRDNIAKNARKIVEVIADKTKIDQFRDNAYALANERYDIKKCIGIYESLYDELLIDKISHKKHTLS